jgi:4-aminobutyrate aminotransferase-like enzyme/Ser/Thr protein kinase RdoA (MazF antagonist)
MAGSAEAPVRSASAESEGDLSQIARARWGLFGALTGLGSLHDRVFRLDIDGAPSAVMKVSTVDRVDEMALTAEAELLRHLEIALPSIQFPLLRPGSDGRLLQRQGALVVRMMDWVQGVPLTRASHWTTPSIHALGDIAGRMSKALHGFDHPGLRRYVEWDPRQAVDVVQGYLPDVTGPERNLLIEALEILRATMPAAEDHPDLPQQAVHLDLTDHNVSGRFDLDGRFSPLGVIDFGDVAWTWRVCELVVSVHAAMNRNATDPLAALRPVVESFLVHQPLTATEVEHLWTLTIARAAICVAAESVEAARSTGNSYVHDLLALDIATLRGILAVNSSLARAAIRTICGLSPHPVDVAAALRQANPAPIVAPESVTAEWGEWLELADVDDDAADSIAPNALRLGAGFALKTASAVRAPLDAVVIADSETTLTLACQLDVTALYVRLEGLTITVGAGEPVARGQVIGTVNQSLQGEDCDIYVQLGVDAAMPHRGKVRDHSLWSALCPYPGILLGRKPPPLRSSTLQQRQRHVAAAQRMYYRAPLEILRAQGQWMYDETGRRYLDMVNNVAIVGHSHPRITEAAAQQLNLLNTNSRFLYRAIADYADRIAETLPAELDSIFLVNSGSEAVELALQLARCYTARHDVVALEGMYHGWTKEVFELCTMPGDRPNWRTELAPYVHIAECPDWYRGSHGADVGPYLTSLLSACTAAEANGGVAAFVHEPVFGSLGGVIPPAGYLSAAYDVVRKFGGVCVADEVQVGYGRTGEMFWAFADQGIVPDIVAAAKAAGNGHPVGFVACRASIADAFAASASFFSTPAGNPVSCRIGTAVLEILRDEGLPHNAAVLGEYLSERLSELAARHREIGAVYGRGLYQGVDLVVADGSTTPLSTADVDAICERLRELGCIVASTGLHGNVLKAKPPLCIRRADVDRFVAALNTVLTERAEFKDLALDGIAPPRREKTND